MCVDCRRVFPSRDAYAMHALMRAQSEVCSPTSAEPSLGNVDDMKITVKREPPSPPDERPTKRPRGQINLELFMYNSLSPDIIY